MVIFKTFAIQNEGVSSVLEGEQYTEKIPTKTIPRYPRKGEILDCNRTPLLTSVSSFDIYMDPTVIDQKVFDKDLESLCDKLSTLFHDKSSQDYALMIRKARINKRRFVTIQKRINNEQRNLLRTYPIFKLGRNKGGLIDTEEIIERKRPHGELLKRTLGYYQKNKDGELKVGIEGAFHSYLVGEPGLEIAQKISTGWKKTGQIVKDAIEGANIITTFDKEIQEVAHSELYRQLKINAAISGSVVVMDVKTGYVRAMSNLTRVENGEYYELYNHAVGTKEVPGSTFKLASLMAALEDNKIDINSKVESARSYDYFGETINEAHNNYYGTISIKEAFELSSNVISKVIYQAYKNEPTTFIDRLKSFGLSSPLGLDIAGEPAPTLYSPGSPQWWRGSLAWVSVGYDVQLTPIQTLAFYNSIANDGKLVKPQFVQEIVRGTETVKSFQPIVLKNQICSNSTLQILKSCLEGVMKKGTGKRLHSSYFDIAGKTGTAEILNDNLKYGNKGEKRYLASFVGYFPVKNPIYSCIVTITANGDNIYGATVSGTVFSAIANKVYAGSLKYHKAINENAIKTSSFPKTKDGNREDLARILKKLRIPFKMANDNEWLFSKNENEMLSFHQRFVGKKTVPNVKGLSAKDAVYLIENTGMSTSIIGMGAVKKQSVPPGTPIFRGGLIELTLE
ncbi:MAG: transpeptidase family protein [Flavobacteriia bacterium]|nr:transpeptidase family protein [Flavobacteriia bacterium]